MDKRYQFELKTKSRPHVVILGAGASAAATAGDSCGFHIPTMDNFIKEAGFGYLFDGFHLHTKSNNLEAIYSELSERSKVDKEAEAVKKKLETALSTYMKNLSLPIGIPTIYDFLVASLTSKDLIATFNWDPLLINALSRATLYGIKTDDELPQTAFLHGNAKNGYCDKCRIETIINQQGQRCRYCGEILAPSKLLYPTKDKNYKSDSHIKSQWTKLELYLKHAYQITIFGYSAPKSDTAAMKLIKNDYGKKDKHPIEQVNFIDLKGIDELYRRFKGLIYHDHYSCVNDFFKSTLATCPRRTNEYLFDVTMNVIWGNIKNGFKQNMSFDDIREIVEPLLQKERTNSKGQVLDDPYVCFTNG